MLLSYLTSFLLCGAWANAASVDLAQRQSRGSLQQVTNFGSNPTNVGFYIYVPNNLAASPGIIVAIHYCTGSGKWLSDDDAMKYAR